MATTTRKTRTPGATEPAPEVKTTAQQADEALDAILGTQSAEPQPEAIAIEQFDAVAEENIKLKEELAVLKKQLGQKNEQAAAANSDIKHAVFKRPVLTDKGWDAPKE